MKGLQSKIILAIGAIHAVEEGGKFDELMTRIQKIEVEDLLLGHILLDKRYDGIVTQQL